MRLMGTAKSLQRRWSSPWFAVAGLLWLGGCSSGTEGATGTSAAAACDPAAAVGGFTVSLADMYTAVSGSIAERPRPVSSETLEAKDGACQLVVRHGLFCDPPCNGGQLCTQGGVCAPEPRNLDVGDV